MRGDAGRRLARALAVGLVFIGLWGCGGGEGEESTELVRALSELGRGISPGGSGFGWADLEALRGPRAGRRWAADALGPGADDLLDDGGAIARGTGFSPSRASSAVAVAGSYALGVRFDDAHAGRLPELLLAAGARSRRAGDWTLYDLGRPAEGRTRGPLAPLGALASRVAVGPAGVVLARFEGARTSLIAADGVLLDRGDAPLEAGTRCLGEVVAARLIPGTFTHNPASSPEMIAIGVRGPGPGGRKAERLCAIYDSGDDAAAAAAAMEEAFAPDAVDAVTGRPIADSVDAAEIERSELAGLEIAAAELEPAPGADPGILFGAFVRGSLLTYLGAERPIPRD